MRITVADLPITGAYTVYDVKTLKDIFSYDGGPEAPGDIPPDVATLDVFATYSEGNRLMIATFTH